VAHMLDTLPTDELLAGCSSLLLVHGIGAAIGPALAGTFMRGYGPSALPVFFAAVLGALTLYLAWRLFGHRRLRAHPSPFHPMLRTTPGVLELLPETETESESESDSHHKENH